MARKNKIKLKKELNYFISIKDDLLKDSEGKFALIKGNSLIGVYKTPKSAYLAGLKKIGRTQFLIKEIVKEEVPESIPTITQNLICASL